MMVWNVLIVTPPKKLLNMVSHISERRNSDTCVKIVGEPSLKGNKYGDKFLRGIKGFYRDV